jgi:hypothetical protein
MDRGWGSFVVGIVGFLAALAAVVAAAMAVAGPADDRPPCTPPPGVHYIDPPDPECRTGWGR